MSMAKELFTRFISNATVKVYRASNGRLWNKMLGMPLLLLTVPGRRTGKLRTKPVVYFKDGDSYIVIGSLGGAPQEPMWFRNLRAARTAVVEVGGRRQEVDVTITGDADRPRLWTRAIEAGPFLKGYQARTERPFPMARLTPRVPAAAGPIGQARRPAKPGTG